MSPSDSAVPPPPPMPGAVRKGGVASGRRGSSRPPIRGAHLSEIELSDALRDNPPPSLKEMRQAILAPVLSASAVLGALALVYEFTLGHHMPPMGMWGIIGVFVVLSTLALRPHWLAGVGPLFPWMLLFVAVDLGFFMGPTTPTFVALAASLFHSALFCTRRQLLAFSLVAAASMGVAFVLGDRYLQLPAGQAWSVGTIVTLTVVVPATIGAYALVQALSESLGRWGELVIGLRREAGRREEALRDLVKAQAQITHTQKLDLLGQLAGGVAHDMNNALTAVMGEASLLDDRARMERERILEAAEHAAQLTQQLMALGRRDVMRPRPIDLGTTVRRAAQAIRRVLPSDIQLQTQIHDSELIVVADPNQLLQVLLNLSQNARDAMGTNGLITISVSPDLDGGALLSVADTGPGIPEEIVPRIFEPFFTTKAPGEGTGLGLSNVKTIVEELRGRLSVDSVAGEGTIFDLWLPTTDQLAQEKESAPTNREERSGTILVVDDDVRVRAIVFTALERVGYRVLEAPTPAVAEVLIKDRQVEMDLVLTDVVMGEGGGARVLDMMREFRPETAVLVMSGYNASETLRRGVSQGEVPFLPKPFMVDQLTDAVDAALRGPRIGAQAQRS